MPTTMMIQVGRSNYEPDKTYVLSGFPFFVYFNVNGHIIWSWWFRADEDPNRAMAAVLLGEW